jgi:hypothetical protein
MVRRHRDDVYVLDESDRVVTDHRPMVDDLLDRDLSMPLHREISRLSWRKAGQNACKSECDGNRATMVRHGSSFLCRRRRLVRHRPAV